jgi:shikimate dehydrogenase
MVHSGQLQQILGIIGYPVSHSLSPLMHNTAIESLGLNYCYHAFEVKPGDIPDAIRGIRAMRIRGINVTIPHKEAVIPLLDEISPETKLMGAVNTISLQGERLIGHNTDGRGFVQSLKLEARVHPRKKNILILGAGGAARGLAIQLASEGASRIVIANRTYQRAEKLSNDLLQKTGYAASTPLPLEDNVIRDCMTDVDIIINTTSIGMKKKDPPVLSYDLLSKRHLVCDIVYHPLETPLLREARKRGARVLNGLGMLIHQGSLSFQIWTGKKFPVDLIRKKLISELTAKGRKRA